MPTAWLGIFALCCYGVHAAVLAWVRHEPWHALWLCHLSNVCIGVGLLRGAASLNACGVCWLAIGTPLWVATMLAGSLELNPTSALTHVVGLGIGVAGARRLGWPPGSWWRAAAGVAALNLLSQALVPFEQRSAHVNLAHGVWPAAMGRLFSDKWTYLVALWIACMGIFLSCEQLARRSLGGR